jgi:hypothetical protein
MEEVVTYFKVTTQKFPDLAEGNDVKLSSGKRISGQKRSPRISQKVQDC